MMLIIGNSDLLVSVVVLTLRGNVEAIVSLNVVVIEVWPNYTVVLTDLRRVGNIISVLIRYIEYQRSLGDSPTPPTTTY